MDLITLRADGAGLVLAPEAGGVVTRYWIDDGAAALDLLRPWSAPRPGQPLEAAGFPLVPYSNRIRAGRFAFRGRDVALPLNRPPERHSIHGHGWQAVWRPLEVRANEATVEYRHDADAWPWAYRATQRFVLAASGLSVELALRNESDTAMPAGIGWHPYFPRTPRTTVTADVRAIWLTDDEAMPTVLAAPRPGADPTRGLMVDAVALDHCFVGWRHRAVIERPESGLRLVMTAESPLDFLVVYTPPQRPFFCAEPVSHATDAFNLAASGRTETGARVLEPGQTLRATVTLRVER
ncbi:MAG: aldose 1-epimerase [Candidatus Rokuibacteriota bacterium]